MKFSKAKPREDRTVPPVDIAIPTFGYQNHISIDREHGLIRKWLATDAAAHEGARLREDLLDKTNTLKSVWADSACRVGGQHVAELGLPGPEIGQPRLKQDVGRTLQLPRAGFS